MRRLNELIDALMSSPDDISGKRPYAREVTRDDAADIAEGLQAEVDRGTAARAEVATKQGMTIACARGCNKCCEELVMVTWPEAHAVARWLRRPENAELLAGFKARYPAWKAAIGDGAERIGALKVQDKQAALQLYTTMRAMCALNQDGVCVAYEVRPIICRNAHALETSDLCGPHPAEAGKVQQLGFVPLDDFVKRAQMLLWAAHHTQPRAKKMKLVALCDAVMVLVS